MRRDLRCPSCHGHAFWQIAALHQPVRGVFPVAVSTRLPAPIGHFELLACAGCGSTAWYAAGLETTEHIDTRASARRCDECGAAHGIHLPATWVHGPGGLVDTWKPLVLRAKYFEGLRFAIDVCRDCSRVAWTARNVVDLRDVVDELESASRQTGACARCSSTTRIVVAGIGDECDIRGHHRGHPLALAHYQRGVLGFGRESAGALDASICDGCNDTTWRATGLDALRVDEKAGVGFVEGRAADAGPYR